MATIFLAAGARTAAPGAANCFTGAIAALTESVTGALGPPVAPAPVDGDSEPHAARVSPAARTATNARMSLSSVFELGDGGHAEACREVVHERTELAERAR